MKFVAILAFYVTTFVVVRSAIDIQEYVKLHEAKNNKKMDFELKNVVDSASITREEFIALAKQRIRNHKPPVLQKYAPYVPLRKKYVTTLKPDLTPIIEEYTSTPDIMKVPTEMTQTTEMTTFGSVLTGVYSTTEGLNNFDTTATLSTTDSVTPVGITTDFTIAIFSTTEETFTEFSTEDLNNTEFRSTTAEETTLPTIFNTEPTTEEEDDTTEHTLSTENEFHVNESSEQSTVNSKYSTTEYSEVNDQSGSTNQYSTESVLTSTNLYSTSDFDSITMEEISTTPKESDSTIMTTENSDVALENFDSFYITTITVPISVTTEAKETLLENTSSVDDVEDSTFTPSVFHSTTSIQKSTFTDAFNANIETTTAVDELISSTIDIENENITYDLYTTDLAFTQTSANIVTENPKYNTTIIDNIFTPQNTTMNITRKNFARNGKNIKVENVLPQPIKYTYDTDVMPTLDDF